MDRNVDRKMNIAVTGSSGLIGTALAAALRGEGHGVVPVVRRAARPGEIGWDPERGTIDAEGLDGLDAVINLAGAGIADKRWTAERKALLLSSREAGTSLLARTLAGLAHPPRVLLSGSAIGIYGDRGDEVLTEPSAPGEGFLPELCRAWETATRPAEEAGIRVAHLRTGLVLAPDGGMMDRLVPLFRFALGGRLGRGRSRRGRAASGWHPPRRRGRPTASTGGPGPVVRRGRSGTAGSAGPSSRHRGPGPDRSAGGRPGCRPPPPVGWRPPRRGRARAGIPGPEPTIR